ncbi:conjugal transfer protein TraE [Vibrio diabolicus]|uniref:ATPase provides energy for both assembly of typeIV secretion complex and secretion of T-DNA complex(VirB4) n=1 Tax=Vibrio sp. FF_273 TaxID=1652830 RepID=A0A0H4A3P5_9VIBR|nr:conjugal transfer protein TraE [Vibrio diabolicus]AKN40894.1 ATPase provides energy for both assembly of typeIV secretion complex and secretion of T-DNA complex(VirB4) [Vibrio sp. FF_273]OCH65470.1 conjugal transfer protein TraE [Vibrio diabolicus]
MSVNGLKTIPLTNQLPAYGYPINRTMIALDDSKLMATLVLSGIPFESESSATLKQAFELVKNILNTLARKHGSKLAVWTHIVKRKEQFQAHYRFESDFMQRFADRYLQDFSGEDFYSVRYYLTFVLDYKGTLSDGEDALRDILNTAISALKRFDCHALTVNEHQRCENIEFLSYLLNYNDQPKPLVAQKVRDYIGHSDWHFGHDMVEVRNANNESQKFATFFELDAFPIATELGMWDFILNQPCEFILTQSMILMQGLQAQKLIDKQINQIASSDNAEHELDELQQARDYVASEVITFGDYHASLVVLGDSPDRVMSDSADLNGQFLAKGTVLKRANLKSPFTFLSTLPASKTRIKPAPKTVTNLACTWSLHNYSTGKASGNPVGDGSAIIPLKTLSNSLFYFNCHASEIGKDVTGEKYAGHTMILGASGSGKTTFEATLTGFFTRFNQHIFCIDYKRSTELFIRAFNGEYFSIKEGEDTGINPFQLENTPKLVSFLNRLVCRLAQDQQGSISAQDEKEIKDAIDSVMHFDAPMRSLSMMLQSIQSPDLRMRLSKWCRSENGKLAWCLDSPHNQFNPSHMHRVGFDSTLLLEKDSGGEVHPASEPVLACLFFLKDLMQESGHLLQTIVEEFWMPANFPLTQAVMKRALKTGRLMNEFMVLSSQSPEDAILCDIFPAIVQQTATKVYLPNPDAEYDAYQKCNLTQGEFNKLKALDKQSRTMLVKQSNTSCFAKLDLGGFDEFLPIISGTTDDITLCEAIRAEVGNHPDNWIPELLKRR